MRTAYSFSILLLLIIWISPASGGIYRYRDGSGNWYYTDSPPPDSHYETVDPGDANRQSPSERDIEKILREKYSPSDSIETATLATVTVTSPVGKGSGFFIRKDGYIITNRHVLRGDAENYRAADEAMKTADESIESAEQQLEKESEALEDTRARLEKFRSSLPGIAGTAQRNAAQEAYEIEMNRYDVWKSDFETRKEKLEHNKEIYETKKFNFNSRKLTADISRQFKIILKDGTEINARLVRESHEIDLALLKVDGFLTPCLSPAPGDLRQGGTVYAIGNPLELRDSVSRGILSGYENSLLKTDAKIYPGNSGGPLINSEGKVLGINTFKILTRNFEGLGFAIPIKAALDEFKEELQ